MKHVDDPERLLVNAVSSMGGGVSRAFEKARVKPRLRTLLDRVAPADLHDAIDRRVLELGGVALGGELLHSLPAMDPHVRGALAEAIAARLRNDGAKRHELTRLTGLAPETPIGAISPERAGSLVAAVAGRGDVLAQATSAFLHERPAALLQMSTAFAGGVLARIDREIPMSPWAAEGEAVPAPSRPAPAGGNAAVMATAAIALGGVLWLFVHQGPPPTAAQAPSPPIVAQAPVPPQALPAAPVRHVPAPLVHGPRPAPKRAAPIEHPKAGKHTAAKPARPAQHHVKRVQAAQPKRAPVKVAHVQPKPAVAAAQRAAKPAVKPAAKPAQAVPAKAVVARAAVPVASVPLSVGQPGVSVAPPSLALSVETDGTTAAQAAVSVVNSYLRALIAGDEAGAFAALGGTAGDKGLSLGEEQFLDGRSRIVSMRAKQLGKASASVEVELQSAKGLYYGTYRVDESGAKAIIESHEFIKP